MKAPDGDRVQVQSAVRRFLKKITLGDGCWEWHAGTNKDGYGVFKNEVGWVEYAHRFAFRLWKGPLTCGKCIRHSCANRLCVNPSHLSEGTWAENNADTAEQGRAWWQREPVPKGVPF